jgi:sulfoxide reductase heme-binding subunit YedZ
MSGHVFWITTRAAGSVALLAASVSLCVGLLMSAKLVPSKRVDLRVTHEALSLTALVALAVHVLSLLADSYFRASILDVTVPFVSGYKEPWMSIGIIAGWGLALLGLSYYARGRIGPDRWRRLHRWTAAAWALGVIHSIGEGTDAGTAWFLAAAAAVVVPADKTAPVISRVSASPYQIWPPNGKMVPVSVTVTASDDVDAFAKCGITEITSSTFNPTDAVITGAFNAQVRAEKDRTYTLHVTCVDNAGNASTAKAFIRVAKEGDVAKSHSKDVYTVARKVWKETVLARR